MVNKFEKMLKDAGMTDKNVKEACEISCAYYYFFDAKGEPSDEGKETIEIFKYRFGDEKKEQVFMKLLYRISGESPTNTMMKLYIIKKSKTDKPGQTRY